MSSKDQIVRGEGIAYVEGSGDGTPSQKEVYKSQIWIFFLKKWSFKLSFAFEIY